MRGEVYREWYEVFRNITIVQKKVTLTQDFLSSVYYTLTSSSGAPIPRRMREPGSVGPFRALNSYVATRLSTLLIRRSSLVEAK